MKKTGIVFLNSFVLMIFLTISNGFSITLTLKPGPSAGKDAGIGSDASNTNFGTNPELAGIAWTCASLECDVRGLLQFDLSSIPPGSIINSATLSLFANPTPLNGNGLSMQGSNECQLQRIISSWDENTVTWNTAPATTIQNQVILSQSTSSFQNYNLNVKNMVQDMVNDPSNSFGFLLRLTTEIHYKTMIFASSDYSNSSKWPEITIEYSTNAIQTSSLNQSIFCAGSAVDVGYTVNATFDPGNVFTAQLSDANGSFLNPTNIGFINSTTSGTINATIPGNIPSGSNYRIRVTASSPLVSGFDNGSNITISHPDDNNPCTTDGTCDPSTGNVSHTPVDVDDHNACTIDACNSTNGNISHTNININDNNPCTTESCNSTDGAITHNPISTDDNNVCTIDDCDSSSGVITHTPVNTDDISECTIDGCDSVSGVFHTPINTDDGDECTADGCNSETGVFHTQICIGYNAYIKNISFIDCKNLEFEVWIEWTGTYSQKFQLLQAGIDFNYNGLANGGVITGAFQPGSADPSLPPAQQSPSWNINQTSKQIRLLAAFATPSSTAAVTPPPPGFRLGKFRITNTNDFSNGVTPDFVWNFDPTTSTTTKTLISFYLQGSTTGTDVTIPSKHFVINNPPFSCSIKLFSNIFIEGYYLGNGQMRPVLFNLDPGNHSSSDCDTILFKLHSATSPYNTIATSKAVLQTNGNIGVNFPTLLTNGSYYISYNHRNSIETWSKSPVFMTSQTNYLFSSSASSASGNNLKITPDNLFWASFSGDIGQDGAIDASDFLILDPSIQNGDSGYLRGDLNGDASVDATDFLILDPNVQLGVGKITP